MTTLLVIYVALLGFLFIFQRHLQYVPMGRAEKPSYYNLETFEEKILTTSDSTKILAWYKKPYYGQKIILHFHGNAGNLGDRSHKFLSFAQNHFGVLAVTYRGYAGSEGEPSERGLIDDGKTALKFLLDQGYRVEDIILFGESMGSGVVAQLAAESQFHAIVFESAFSSAEAVAKKSYWFVPVGLLLKDKFKSIDFAAKITSPTLFFHKTKDHVVPYSEGQKLFNAVVSKQKKFVTVEGFGHVDFTPEFLTTELQKFLKDVHSAS